MNDSYVAQYRNVTNIVILEHDSEKVPPNHKEVMETAHMRAADMRKLVKCVIEKLAQTEGVSNRALQ